MYESKSVQTDWSFVFYLQVEKLMYMEPVKNSRTKKLIKFKVWMKQFAWLPLDFSTYFGHN